VAQTANQRAIAAIFDAEEMSAIGDLDTVIDALVFTTTPQALNAFDTASGEIHASVMTSALSSARGFQQTNRVFAPTEDGTTIWGVAIGQWQRHNGDEFGNAYTVDNDSNGFAAGISKRKANKYIGAGVQTIALDSTREFGQSRPVDASLTHLTVVAGLTSGPVELDASLGYGWYNFDVERDIIVGSTISRKATSSYDGSGVTAGIEARLDSGQSVAGYAVKPYVSIDYSQLNRDAFTESGAQSLNVIAQSGSHESTIFGAGLGLSKTTETGGDWTLRTSARLGLAHETGPIGAVLNGRFQGQTNSPNFTVLGVTPSRTRADIGAGLALRNKSGMSLHLNVRGEYGKDTNNTNVLAGISYKFK
jgi:outer membrane autotransporter protein